MIQSLENRGCELVSLLRGHFHWQHLLCLGRSSVRNFLQSLRSDLTDVGKEYNEKNFHPVDESAIALSY